MRAVGFSKYKTNRELNKIFEAARKESDIYVTYADGEKDSFFELTKMAGNGFGLTWMGSIEDGEPVCEYCYPIVKGEEYVTEGTVCVEERIIGNAYTGAFEDFRAGVLIIFFLQNGADYLKIIKAAGREEEKMKVALSGLALDGAILLPLASSEERNKKRVREQKQRIKLLAAAKQGDEKAMESLAYQDMNIYTKVSKRILTEDVFSIVESSFMPYGTECDRYAIVADIIRAEKAVNLFTKEKIWKLKLGYNGILIDICINQQDLVGEPKEGRRFKGNIWLQGQLKQIPKKSSFW